MTDTPLTISAEIQMPHQPIADNHASRQSAAAANIRESLSECGVVHLQKFVDAKDIQNLKLEIDYLFDNFPQLPTQISPRADAGNIREIANLVRQYPVFGQSLVYRKCYALASEIFGRQCHYGFDHSICKAQDSAAVHWHQDQFYSNFDRDKQCISFWIPLQAVTTANGGMQYAVLPVNSTELLPHTPVNADSFMYHIDPKHLSEHATISPDLNVGDVCLHTPLTIHRSHPNSGQEARSAWILQFNKYGPLRFARWTNIRKQLARLVTVKAN